MTGESRGGTASLGGNLRDPAPADHEPALVPGRSCGSCSLCCKVLPVREFDKPAGEWCLHCVPGSGCAVHADRPHACREFFCSWRLDPNLGPEWKPEACRFVLATDPTRQALTVMVDPGMPLAWKREPYYSRLKRLSEVSFRQDAVLVNSGTSQSIARPRGADRRDCAWRGDRHLAEGHLSRCGWPKPPECPTRPLQAHPRAIPGRTIQRPSSGARGRSTARLA